MTRPDNTLPLWVQALLDKSLSAVEYRVWSYLYWRQGGNGSTWPAKALIASELGMSVSTVERAIRRLCRSGRLTKAPGKKSGRGHTNHYSINHVTHDGVSDQNHVTYDGVSDENHVIHDGKTTSPVTDKHYTRTLTEEHLLPPQGDGDGQVPGFTRGRCEGDCPAGPAPASMPRVRRTAKRPGRPVRYTPDFQRVWAEYPKKVGKVQAFREWQKLDPDKAMIEQIVVSIRAWKRSDQWTKDNGKYVVYLCRFLKYRRFEDELPGPPEPQFGDPDWVPTEEELEARQRAGRGGGK